MGLFCHLIWGFYGLFTFFWVLFFFVFLSSLCVSWVCVCGAVEDEDRNNKKRSERLRGRGTWGATRKGESPAVQPLQSSPCKPTMVVEVCCHCHELSIALTSPLNSVFFKTFIYLFICFPFFFLFFPVSFVPFFLAFNFFLNFFLSFSFFHVFNILLSVIFKLLVLYFFLNFLYLLRVISILIIFCF